MKLIAICFALLALSASSAVAPFYGVRVSPTVGTKAGSTGSGGGGGQTISDDFNRADNNDIGANWTAITSEQAFRIVSQTVQYTSGNESADHSERYSGVTWTANQSSECKVTCGTGVNPGAGYGVIVRASDSTRSYYRLVINGDGEWEMGVNNSGTFTSLASGTTTFSSGATLKLSVTGTSPPVLVSTYNGSQINSHNHTTGGTPLTSGWVGIAYSSTAITGTIDDWTGIDGL